MRPYEINLALQYSYLKHKDSWEQARLVCYIQAQINNKKKLKVDDILPFFWDKIEKDEPIIEKKDIERLNKKVYDYLSHLNT